MRINSRGKRRGQAEAPGSHLKCFSWRKVRKEDNGMRRESKGALEVLGNVTEKEIEAKRGVARFQFQQKRSPTLAEGTTSVWAGGTYAAAFAGIFRCQFSSVHSAFFKKFAGRR